MALVIDVRLLQGRYEAEVDGGRGEWPPHPARMFCALASVAHEPGEQEALRWLETLPAPQVWAPDTVAESRASEYVVTNKTSKGGSHHWPGRTTILRSRTSVTPAADGFAFVWPDLEPVTEMVQQLDKLAWKVPYLGRSSCSVALRVHTAPKLRDEWRVWRLAAERGVAESRISIVRIYSSGYLDALNAAFESGVSACDKADKKPYIKDNGPEEAAAAHAAVAGPFGEVLTFSIPAGTVRPEGIDLLRWTQTLRRAVLSLVGDGAAPAITGHVLGGRGHVAYLGLVDAGHANARGHLVGLGVALPADLDADAQAQLVARVRRELTLTMGRYGDATVRYEPWPSKPNRLRPEFWSAGHAGATRWTTVTPVMLDRYLKPRHDPAEELARCLVTAGYPEPAAVQVSDTPLLRGALHRPGPATYPEGRPRRRLLHARVAFPEPVRGPVLAGSMRYLGLGLFTPDRPSTTRTEEKGGTP
ncbi:type I-G CRISPR-associated protein Csb2 [Actinomadura atramentaria]|uniref:type I-G CRISPR-associated protein Csb2 n=1 Tax=Actinomadura atramentaria TaxID=1990 RepID=UPI0003A07D77|nr:type I-U CRISPR-associated protein Csb2 [Actinomadura atramentaria]